MKKITIGFSRPKKWNPLSYLIMKIQGTPYSHVYLQFESTSLDRKLVYQASGLQVNFIGSVLFQDHHMTVKEFELEISDEAHKKTLQKAVDLAGMPYSKTQLFDILIHHFTGKSVLKDGRSAYVCSELVAEMLKDLDIHMPEDLDVVEPKDIYEVLDKAYGKIK